MKTKQEVIKKAYGEGYHNSNPDSNGWSNCDVSSEDFNDFWDYSDIRSIVEERFAIAFIRRSKSLRGIENNNGWITIINDEYFPDKEMDCFFIKGKLMYKGVWDNKLKRFYSGDKWISNVFQYQEMKMPELPLHQ